MWESYRHGKYLRIRGLIRVLLSISRIENILGTKVASLILIHSLCKWTNFTVQLCNSCTTQAIVLTGEVHHVCTSYMDNAFCNSRAILTNYSTGSGINGKWSNIINSCSWVPACTDRKISAQDCILPKYRTYSSNFSRHINFTAFIVAS